MDRNKFSYNTEFFNSFLKCRKYLRKLKINHLICIYETIFKSIFKFN